ncbi:MAG: hypothetical protein HRU24_08015 [Gammaproteobacteria bacterium]|nr:hypothetical protein [Gammaproteobacteria bacterium]
MKINYLLTWLLMVFSSSVLAINSKELTDKTIAQAMSPSPRLVIMWSLECPACFDELDTIALLINKHPNLAISLIATDQSRATEIAEVYQQPEFSNLSRWHYGNQSSHYLNDQIDPYWQGELPRSYYVDLAGKRYGHSGLLSKEQILSLLKIKQ